MNKPTLKLRFTGKTLALSFATLLVASSSQASTYSNKTFLMPRVVNDNMAMQYSGKPRYSAKYAEHRHGTGFKLTGFYQESTNETDIGQYFGVDKKNEFVIANGQDINYNFIFHDYPAVGDPLAPRFPNTSANVKFEPDQTVYGVRLDFYQKLDFLLENLFFKAHTSFVNVENDMNMQISNATDLFETNDNLKNYFAGKYENITVADGNLQEKLTHAKIDGKQNTTGFADVDLTLGYKLLKTDKYNVALKLALTIPTGNKVEGKYLFEPVRGNGRHYAVGGGLGGKVKLWEKDEKALKLIHVFNYKYILKDEEKRILSFNRTFEQKINYSHYYLLGKIGNPTNSQLIPAANILTTGVDVTPGSQLESLTALAFSGKNLMFDFGYNMFFKQAESLKLKDNPFANDSYGVADQTFNTNDAGGFGQEDIGDQHALSTSDLDFDAASTPAQFTHKLFTGLGYAYEQENYTAVFSVGGSYEFATNNSELENWAAWGKVGLSF